MRRVAVARSRQRCLKRQAPSTPVQVPPTAPRTGGSRHAKRNLAARAGLWSASHRKKAIFGWLAFVVLAMMIGGAIGQQELAQEDMGNGDSKVADQALAAGFPQALGEQVLIQGKRVDPHGRSSVHGCRA